MFQTTKYICRFHLAAWRWGDPPRKEGATGSIQQQSGTQKREVFKNPVGWWMLMISPGITLTMIPWFSSIFGEWENHVLVTIGESRSQPNVVCLRTAAMGSAMVYGRLGGSEKSKKIRGRSAGVDGWMHQDLCQIFEAGMYCCNQLGFCSENVAMLHCDFVNTSLIWLLSTY